MSEKILVIEDDVKMSRMIELELSHEGYLVTKAFDGLSGLDEIENNLPDIVLLDIMLPGLSGIEVLRRIRKTSDVPVILLTARDSIVDKVSGLDSGADDYVTKPFAIEELLARVRVVLRKSQKSNAELAEKADLLKVGQLVMDVAKHQVTYGDVLISLTHKEFELLHCLLLNKNIAMTREALLNNVWGYDYIGETNAVDVYIRFLRSKIDDKFNEKIINTVRGVGYQIKDE